VNLFLHLDKSIYQPGETVWFTGYVLSENIDQVREQNTLYTVLVDPISRKPLLRQRFLIKNGLGKGFLSLPDTLAEGKYWVLAYTNAVLEKGPQPIFRQLISLRSRYAPAFHISDPIVMPPAKDGTTRIRYKINMPGKGLAIGGKVEYTVFGKTTPIASGSQIIGPSGEITIPIDSGVLAASDLQLTDVRLTARVSRDGITRGFILSTQRSRPVTTLTNRPDISQPVLIAFGGGPYEGQGMIESPVRIFIEPDSLVYHSHSKVILHIRICNSSGQRIPAVFSLAVVSSKRFDPAQTPSIEEFIDKRSPEIISTPPMAGNSQMPDYGYVLCDGGRPNKPVSLVMTGNGFTTLITDSAGRFELPQDLLVSPAGGTNYLTVAESSVDRYKIIVHSKADTLDQLLASKFYPVDPNVPETPDPDEEDLPADPGLLQATIVKAKAPNEYNDITGEYNSRHCQQDTVYKECDRETSGVLNLPYPDQQKQRGHFLLKEKPTEGGQYYLVRHPEQSKFRDVFEVREVIYHCAAPAIPPFMTALQPILISKSFPRPDSCQHTLPGSSLQSTLFWSHSLSTIDKEEVTVSFYTNELPGNFTCSLQGICTEGALRQAISFSVK
jgi:hypothetical protein